MIAAIHHEPDRLRDALRAIQEERATDDPLNALVLRKGSHWREVEVLRTLRNHLLQVRPNYNVRDGHGGARSATAAVAGALFRLFDARFDPHLEGDRAERDRARRRRSSSSAFKAVGSLFDDEILRGRGEPPARRR